MTCPHHATFLALAVAVAGALMFAPAPGRAQATTPPVVAAEAARPCDAGKTGCATTGAVPAPTANKVELAVHAARADCARDAQDCDARTKARRGRADADARDRHACRD